MKITKRQLRRIIREASETAAEERGMAASYQRGYSDGWSTPRSPVTTGRDPEYLRGYEKGAADAEDASGEGKYIRESEGSTKKWDGDSALIGKQKSKLHDKLQKGIIDKVVKDREEREEEEREEKELGESVKITKRQLRRIIKEEKAKLLKEIPSSHGNPGAAGQDEAEFLADFSSTMDAIKEIATGVYGLIDPADAGLSISAGDDMANDLELQIERLNDLYIKFERHLEYGGNLLTPA